ncbi:MAG: hypothetical protein GY864_03300 [Desulfobacterales bacterium]|nr:hypothetical protein [Desulfobacterales bacterium]
MRQSILAPLCSALVIPGLGQILNQHLKKGIYILGAVFVLFIIGAYKLAQMAYGLLGRMEAQLDTQRIIDTLGREDTLILCLLLGAFGMLWIYSVLDACLVGLKIDREGGSR